ncbi:MULTISPECIES: SDR family NAD(P)-dependent oxidoreductase [unclassified Clostridium]|uniref:SDR family NAD(P)-dependent oxidoreductase n=1 Tax=unclassified Clostridium TaxID=2614128 RepID=UPI000EE5E8B7|nr:MULTISPECIES: SDR family NAD(P)-dependent oxidoreductase [unclassified Clostridium]HCQ88822.1 short-chain dehydrogenase [Clostridium sp.]
MKKILITGAGSGLGAELAKCYGEDKNHIILVGRNKEKLAKILNEIIQMGATAEYVTCDISNPKSVEELGKYISENHITIDYLINNAGVGFFGPLGELTISEMDTMINVNIKGTILVTQKLLPCINQKILNIISTAGLRGKANETIYSASKFAVRGFTESLQKELADKDIKITAVYMGGMDTPFWEDSTYVKDISKLKSPSEVAKEIKSKDDGRGEIIIGK